MPRTLRALAAHRPVRQNARSQQVLPSAVRITSPRRRSPPAWPSRRRRLGLKAQCDGAVQDVLPVAARSQPAGEGQRFGLSVGRRPWPFTYDDVTLLTVSVGPADMGSQPPSGSPTTISLQPSARRFIHATLTDRLSTIDTVELCVSELVMNAVIHSGTAAELTVRLHADVLTVSVRDSGGDSVVLGETFDAAHGGRSWAEPDRCAYYGLGRPSAVPTPRRSGSSSRTRWLLPNQVAPEVRLELLPMAAMSKASPKQVVLEQAVKTVPADVRSVQSCPSTGLLGGLVRTTASELLGADRLGRPFPRSDSRPTPVLWQVRADVTRSTHYNRRHFHVWPSSVETTTLLPLQSQIELPLTAIATCPSAPSKPEAQRIRPPVRLPFNSVSDCTVTPSQSLLTRATQYRPLPAVMASVLGIWAAGRQALPELRVLIAVPLSQTIRARDTSSGARPMT